MTAREGAEQDLGSRPHSSVMTASEGAELTAREGEGQIIWSGPHCGGAFFRSILSKNTFVKNRL